MGLRKNAITGELRGGAGKNVLITPDESDIICNPLPVAEAIEIDGIGDGPASYHIVVMNDNGNELGGRKNGLTILNAI